MFKGSQKLRIAIIWVIFIGVLLFSGMLMSGRLKQISLEYMSGNLSIQAEYIAKSVSDELLRETDKLKYVAGVIEKDGNIENHLNHAVIEQSDHISTGLIDIKGNVVAGDQIIVSDHQGILDSFRGNVEISFSKDCLIFTCPVFNGNNVEYVIYELFDRTAMEERFSFYSHKDRKVSLNTNEGDLIMLFYDVDESEFFASDDYKNCFAVLYKEMGLKNSEADFFHTDKGDYFCFVQKE